MQNPIVNRPAAARRPSRDRRAAPSTAASMSAEMPGPGRLRSTCGMYSKSAPRRSAPAVRPNQSMASGVDAALREPQRELLVVRVEAADVGQDDDRRPGSATSAGRGTPRTGCRRAAVSSSSGAVEGAAGDRGDRRPAVVVEAHGGPPWPTLVGSRPRSNVARTGRRPPAQESLERDGRMPRDAQPPRRPEVRWLVGRRRGPHQAGRPADRARARGRPRPRRRRLGDGRHHRRAARPRRRRSPTNPIRASSTCCSRPASTRARPSCRWRSTRSASRRSA